MSRARIVGGIVVAAGIVVVIAAWLRHPGNDPRGEVAHDSHHPDSGLVEDTVGGDSLESRRPDHSNTEAVRERAHSESSMSGSTAASSFGTAGPRIHGTVRTLGGAPIHGAEVVIRERSALSPAQWSHHPSDALAATSSDDDGRFSVALPVAHRGSVQLAVRADGFGPLLRALEPSQWSVPLTLKLGPERAVTVTVLGPRDTVIPGANVWCTVTMDGDLHLFEGTTDDRGRFGVESVPTGHVHVEAVAPGFAPARTWGDGVTGDASLVARLAEAGTVWGTVTDTNDLPVPGAIVQATQQMLPSRAEAVSDEQGRYRIDSAPLGQSLTVGAFPPRSDPLLFGMSLEPQNHVLEAGQRLRVDLVVHRRDGRRLEVRGRTVDSRQRPLEGVLVLVRDTQDAVIKTRTLADGTFSLNAPAEPLSFWAHSEESYLDLAEEETGRDFTWTPIGKEADVASWDLGVIVLQRGRTLRGVVRNGKGVGLRGSLIALRPRGRSYRRAPLEREAGAPWTAWTDEAGQFQLEGVPDHGELVLTTSHPTSARVHERVVAADENDIEWTVAAPAVLRGRVELPNGDPAPHVLLQWRAPRAEGENYRPTGAFAGRADESGRFYLADLPVDGDLLVRTSVGQVSRDWYLPLEHARMSLTEARETVCTVRLSPTVSLHGILLDAERRPAADHAIGVHCWLDGTADVSSVTVRTDHSGRFRLEGLTPTEYEVRVRDPSDELIATFTGTPGGPDVQWELPMTEGAKK